MTITYDTIEIDEQIINGPSAGEYKTISLNSEFNNYHNYCISKNILYLRKFKIEKVPEDERKHPIFDIIRPVYLGKTKVDYTGHMKVYSAFETWKLKFINGGLVETMFEPTDDNDTQKDFDSKDSNSSEEVAYWSGEGYVEEDNDEYEG
jgi:hypothetical protein